MKDWICGFVFVVIGLATHIVGVASPYWVVIDGVDFGLWQICGDAGCVSFLMYENTLSVWFHVVQALALAGTLGAILAFFTSALYLKSQSLAIVLVPGLSAFLGGTLIGTSVLVYAVKEWSFSVLIGWAFYMECVASAMLLVSSVILFIAAGRTKLKSRVVPLGASSEISQKNVTPELTTEL